MKKAILICLSVIVGLIGYFFTFAASFKLELGKAYCTSYLGVIIPNIVLEIIKYLCYKPKYKKIYAFDIISTLICFFEIIYLNILLKPFYNTGSLSFWKHWKESFFLYQLPWFIMLSAYILLLIFKSEWTKKKIKFTQNELPPKFDKKNN